MTINPELVLACAKLAKPDKPWQIFTYGSRRLVEYHAGEGHMFSFDYNNPADHDALVGALMDEGNGKWIFGKGGNGYYGKRRTKDHPAPFVRPLELVTDPSRPLCTLKAVAAQTGIPLEGR